ncbi:MAG TPA: alkyl sulfatase dimerization domain-containing protein [Solirubrobacteraceae bacterium]|jgi:alkyl sulfatase BDS1-like metallo-beta-lactamase superfamily hydrolase
MSDRQDATEFTKAVNDELLSLLPFEDRQDFEDAARGHIAEINGSVVHAPDGRVTWDPNKFAFVGDDRPCPPTVNPSLWRQSQLCAHGGLFKVVERMYQVRNHDISNLTIVEGDTGLILFDPLISVECSAAALELYFEHRPRKPVVAVVYSHSHVDHYGGVKGVISEEDVAAGKVRVIAPEGFLEAAVSENIMAGNVMTRRALYQYGSLIPFDERGNIGLGLGTSISLGTITLIAPTETITETGQKLEIDGLTFEFMLAPDTEAPSEMHWFIEELGALTAAENCCHTLHNTYTLRGAQIRDPHAWSQYLGETIERWGHKADVLYGMHHWPVWGSDRAVDLLSKGRDAYGFINDETLRLANHGFGPAEIAEQVKLPDVLDRHWALRGYYGTLNHNVKATYVKYLGWFDGNPATLYPLPPEDSAKKYLEFMGGADAVLEKARAAYARGEYRWVAEVVNHVVFAEPSNTAARELQANTLEQLGYQSEAGTWRNLYLTGAQELRHGTPNVKLPSSASEDSIKAMSLDLFFNYLGVRLNGERAGATDVTLNWVFTDTDEQVLLRLSNGALSHVIGRTDDSADATITLTRAALNRFILGQSTLDDEAKNGEITVEPEIAPLDTLLGLLDDFDLWFNIVEP